MASSDTEVSPPCGAIAPSFTITVIWLSELTNDAPSTPFGVSGIEPVRLLGATLVAARSGGGLTHR